MNNIHVSECAEFLYNQHTHLYSSYLIYVLKALDLL